MVKKLENNVIPVDRTYVTEVSEERIAHSVEFREEGLRGDARAQHVKQRIFDARSALLHHTHSTHPAIVIYLGHEEYHAITQDDVLFMTGQYRFAVDGGQPPGEYFMGYELIRVDLPSYLRLHVVV